MPRAPSCRLYLVSPPGIDDPAEFLPALLEVVAAGDIACFRLDLPGADEAIVAAAAKIVFPPLQDRGVACLVSGAPALVAATGADGVHLGTGDMTVAKARAMLAADSIIGADCLTSRHLAMEAAERGADYVSFQIDTSTHADQDVAPTGLALLDWWQVMMEVPCVAAGRFTPANCAAAIEAGADFLAVGPGIWDWPQGPVSAVAAISALARG